jgi:hypothetical protein
MLSGSAIAEEPGIDNVVVRSQRFETEKYLMMKLMFYRGPGSIITRTIRRLTNGPYSHVELQFSNGRRFFASGHGVLQGSDLIRDHRVYDASWDTVFIPATQEQEKSAQRYAFGLIGIPFDMRGMIRFMFPGGSHHKFRYCSAVVMDVLQSGLHMFPGESLKISPNGLHRLFLSHKHSLTSEAPPDDKKRCRTETSNA